MVFDKVFKTQLIPGVFRCFDDSGLRVEIINSYSTDVQVKIGPVGSSIFMSIKTQL